MKKTTIITRGPEAEVLRDIKEAIAEIVRDTAYCPKLIITIETEEND